MIAGANDLESQRAKGTQDSVGRCIDRNLATVDEARDSGGKGRLGHKRLENWIVLGGCECRCAEGLDVEGACKADIRKRRLVSVALADDRATRKAKRISDVAIGVLLDDDFQLWCHVWRMPRKLDSGKIAKSPNVKGMSSPTECADGLIGR